MGTGILLLAVVLLCAISPAVLLCADGSGDLDVLVNVTYLRPSDFTKEHPYYRAGSVVTLTCYVNGIQGQGLRYGWTSNCSDNRLTGSNASQSITLTALSSSHSGLYTCTVWEGNTCSGNATTEIHVVGVGIYVWSTSTVLTNNSVIIANLRDNYNIPKFECLSGSRTSITGQFIGVSGDDITSSDGDPFTIEHGSNGALQVQGNGRFYSNYDGVYSCRIPAEHGQTADVNVGIYLRENLTVTASLEQSEAITPFTLTCDTVGAPPTEVSWSKDGVEIDLLSDRNKYTLEQVLINRDTAHYRNVLIIIDDGDNLVGRYSCEVPQYLPDSQSNSVELKAMEVTGHENPIIVGLMGKLVCLTRLRVTSIQWFLVGLEFPLEATTEQELVFTIDPESTALNAAMFTCKITTELQIYEKTVSIIVRELEHNVVTTSDDGSVMAGQSTTIVCTATSDLAHTITWIGPDGTPLSSDGSSGSDDGTSDTVNGSDPEEQKKRTQLTLSLDSVTTSLAGQYTCKSVVEYPPSARSATYNLFVKIPPPNLILTHSPSDRRLYTTTPLNIMCAVLINAAVDTDIRGVDQWSGPQGALVQSSGIHINKTAHSHLLYNSLVGINSLQSSDSGTYTFSVVITDATFSHYVLNSSQTTASVSITVALNVSINVVYTGPSGDLLRPPNYRPGSSITIQCVVEGATGSVRYVWSTTCTSSNCFVRNGYTGSTLRDSFLRYDDTGDHTCTVMDGIGNTGTSTAVVNVQGIGGYIAVSEHGNNQPMANHSIIVSKSCNIYPIRFAFYCCSNQTSISDTQLIGSRYSYDRNVKSSYNAGVLRYSSSPYPGCVQFRSYISSSYYYRCYSGYYFESNYKGVYTCRMKDTNGGQQDLSMAIYPYGFNSPPVVTSMYQFKSQSVLTLKCISTNSAATNVTWMRNGRSLKMDGSKYKLLQMVTSRRWSTYSNELHICDFPNRLGGSYSCRVSNIFGTSNNIATIIVQGWTIVGYDEVMYAGEKRNLSCSTDLTFTRLEWVNKTDNRVLKTTAVGNRVDLLIPSLSTRHNGNKLACRIVTSCGTDEKSITLNITIPEDWGEVNVTSKTKGTPTETYEYTLQCTVNVVPNVEEATGVVWVNPEGQEIGNNTHTGIVSRNLTVSETTLVSTLTFLNLNSSHGGFYTCMAVLDVSGLDNIPPLIDDYRLIVTSQSLIQLRFGPVEHCIHWTVAQSWIFANAIRKSLTDTINRKCECNFDINAIYTGEFSCQTTKYDAIYRTVINGTSDSLTAPELVNHIREWKGEDGTFPVDLLRLRVETSCPLVIESFSEKECSRDGGKILDEEEDGADIELKGSLIE